MEIKATEEQLKIFGLEVKADSIVWRGQKNNVSMEGKPVNFDLIIFNFPKPIPKDQRNDLDCFSYQRHTVFEQYDFPQDINVTVLYNPDAENISMTFTDDQKHSTTFIVTK